MKKWWIVVVVVAVAACGWFYLKRSKLVQKQHVQNVVLVTIDTLRADHLGIYGYALAHTPNIDRIAREGALFRQATAVTPLTLPSHSSIMTGEYPTAHGVRDNGGFYLDDKWKTLAETMREGGFTTGGFVSAFVLDRRWGIAQGFNRYFDNFELSKFQTVSMDSVQRRGDETMKEALDWIGKNKQSRFFAWIHLYDPHTPYDPPEPYRSEAGKRKFGLYDGEVAFTDSLIGQLDGYLKENHLDSTTMIILTADHGESLGEHEESGHGFFIYDATTHVPLIIRSPGAAPQSLTEQVRGIDLYPTICEATGVTPPAMDGVSLMPLVQGKKLVRPLDAYSESFYARFHYGWSELKAVRTADYKYIDAPRAEFYRVSEDIDESDNVFAASGNKSDPFLKRIQEISAKESASATAPQPIDEDSLEKLQALGYIGSFTTAPDVPGQKLPDPKDKIALYNEIKLAQWLSAEGKVDEAVAGLTKVLAADEGILEAHLTLGNIRSKQGDPPGARESYQKALALNPDSTSATFGMAVTYEKEKNWEAARAGFERVLQLDKRDAKALFRLGDIALAEKKFDEALTHFKKAVDIDANQALSRNRLGACLLELKRYDEALPEFQKALELNARMPNAHFNRALVFEARGDSETAISEYRKELELFPEAYPAYFNLSRIYGRRRDLNSERTALEECIRVQPEFGVAYLYLAKNWMDSGRELPAAKDLAEQGIAKTRENENLAFGHFVLADLYNRMGQQERAMEQVRQAKKFQSLLAAQNTGAPE